MRELIIEMHRVLNFIKGFVAGYGTNSDNKMMIDYNGKRYKKGYAYRRYYKSNIMVYLWTFCRFICEYDNRIDIINIKYNTISKIN
jgi:hypothetical protein